MSNGIVWQFQKSSSLTLEIAQNQIGYTVLIKKVRVTKVIFRIPLQREDMTTEAAVFCILKTLIVLRTYLVLPEGIRARDLKYLLQAIQDRYQSKFVDA